MGGFFGVYLFLIIYGDLAQVVLCLITYGRVFWGILTPHYIQNFGFGRFYIRLHIGGNFGGFFIALIIGARLYIYLKQ